MEEFAAIRNYGCGRGGREIVTNPYPDFFKKSRNKLVKSLSLFGNSIVFTAKSVLKYAWLGGHCSGHPYPFTFFFQKCKNF